MPRIQNLDRRRFLRLSAAFGCSAAAAPLMTRVTFAAVPGDNRLVVLILRGAMDGLDVLRPVGDPDFAGLRGPDVAGEKPAADLDGFFALHPALADLLPMWRAGGLGFAHAVSTPYRNKRSHFDGQDILEAGSGLDVPDSQIRDGWLNRLIQALPGATGETAYAIGLDQLKVISGAAPVRQWSPDARIELDAQSRRLLERLYEGDPLFHAAGNTAFDLAEAALANETDAAQSGEMVGDMAEDMADGMAGDMSERTARETAKAPRRAGVSAAGLAAFAARKLRAEARIAAFSINGWDTHRDQRQVLGGRLEALAAALGALERGLGPEVWGKTTVLAMTEFGRTVRANGTAGTDHGTGGAMLLAGGAVRGGRVLGDWPGLDESSLYERRDLMPTRDVRAFAGWTMRGLFGLDRSLIEGSVFPGLDMGDDPGVLL